MKDKPILICFGTRPEWLKIKPLVEKLSKDKFKLLFTGQHVDLLNNIHPDYEIPIQNNLNRLDDIISSCLVNFPNGTFRAVLVQGDTASAFACALAAFNRSIPIYYLEAGLRTNDLENPYPEEAYRQMISRISSVNFAPTELSAENLTKENKLLSEQIAKFSEKPELVGDSSMKSVTESAKPKPKTTGVPQTSRLRGQSIFSKIPELRSFKNK